MTPTLKSSVRNPFFFFFIVCQLIGWTWYWVVGKEQTFYTINGFGGQVTDLFFFSMTQLGEWPMIVFVIASVWLKFRPQTLNIMLVFASNALTSFILKNFVFTNTPRPAQYFIDKIATVHFSPYQTMNYWQSFPSGHTYTAFAGLFFLALLVNKSSVYVLCFVLALLAGISRIYNGMHFTEDVLTGALLGVINTLLVVLLVPPIKSWSNNRGMQS
ncbi:MAG: phosphatase PAP2 family protein [Bacteroidia bacterium]|nr:phosphatase PAP2 family protein [Bacteroidia bacterium]MCO5252767.1 phosphatase PAP2 family protein [Bacteroidota bacterium]MCZ2129572.1 phosphatase PAP2 family protein [Bacteroidia bacterium]